MSSKTLATDHPLPPKTRAQLRALVGEIVPASTCYGVPGADDDLIFAEIASELGTHAAAISTLDAAIEALLGARLETFIGASRTAAAKRVREAVPRGLDAVVVATMQCYYRDDRIMRSLGMEPRPPFPRGFAVEEGDWSLLDPVRARAKLWRDAPR
jgi:hypothetical protein